MRSRALRRPRPSPSSGVGRRRHLFGISPRAGPRRGIVARRPRRPRGAPLGARARAILRALALVGRTLVFETLTVTAATVARDERATAASSPDNLGARQVARGDGHVLVSVRPRWPRPHPRARRGRARASVGSRPGPRRRVALDPPGGRAWTVRAPRRRRAAGYYRCAFDGGARGVGLIMPYATRSPDGTLVAYVDPVPQGPRARLVAIEGGAPRDLGDASSYCAPSGRRRTRCGFRDARGRAGVGRARRRRARAALTGRTRRGARDCSGRAPRSRGAVRDGAKIVVERRSELRVHAAP